MGLYLFCLPDVGEGVVEAEIVEWYVKPGDVVEEDDNLVDVMTDKATVEMTAVHPGTVTAIHGEPGDSIAVGAVLVEIEVEGKDFEDNEESAPAEPDALSDETTQAESAPAPAAAPQSDSGNYLFRLPDVGEGVVEAEIVEWYVKPGDIVEEDDNLVDVMTDKATVEMTAVHPGTIEAIHGNLGDSVAVGAVLVEIKVEGMVFENSAEPSATGGDAAKDKTAASKTEQVKPEPTPKSKTAPESKPKSAARPTATSTAGSRPSGLNDIAPLAAPATRARAFELGIPLQFVPGTGSGGRITPTDLDAYVESGGNSGGGSSAGNGLAMRTGHTETKIIGIRRKIAERMQDAKSRIPHITYVEETDITDLEKLRATLNADKDETQPKLTLLPFLMRALALVQPHFPHVFSHFDDDANVLHSYDGVHVGIAAATDAGLMVPVVRHVEALDIWGCAHELATVSKAARDGTASREVLSGSTITLTSLGPLAGITSTPVINSPEVAIIAPNKIAERLVLIEGQPASRKIMNISSSFDHRIVDGYDAALFIQRIKKLLENPVLLFAGQS